MNKWLVMAVLVLFVLTGAVVSTGAPVRPSPRLVASTTAPVPPSPWLVASTTAPVPPSPWL